MLPFLENFILGFAISAVPGAVFFETIRRSVIDHASVLRFLVGNFSGMLVIVIASYFGIATLLSDGIVSAMFYLVSGSLLIYLGMAAVLANKKKMERLKADAKSSKNSAYFTGLTLAIANPISIIFWTSQMGKFLEEQSGNIGALFDSLTVLAGALALFTVLVGVSRLIKSKLTLGHLLLLSRLFGAIITLYGLTTFVAAFKYFY